MHKWPRHRKHRIAQTMLWVWLFGLLMSGVNACLTQGPSSLASAQTWASPAAHGHDDPGAPGKAVCQDFCDDGQSTIAKNPAAQTPSWDGATGVIHLAWSFVDRIATGQAFKLGRHAGGGAPPPGPPVTIRFSRLTT